MQKMHSWKMEESKYYPHIQSLDSLTMICKVTHATSDGLISCDKQIARSGGSSNVRRHLFKQHPEILSQIHTGKSKNKTARAPNKVKVRGGSSQLKDHGYFFMSDAGEYNMKEEISAGMLLEDDTDHLEQDDLIEETEQDNELMAASGGGGGSSRVAVKPDPIYIREYRDECDAYGAYVAEVLKKMEKKARAELKREIGNLIFQIETNEAIDSI